MSISILIADDHLLLRQGIKGVLDFEKDLEVIGEASDGVETVEKVDKLKPDILLLDLNMPHMNGIDVTKQLRILKSKTKIIMLTIHDDDNYIIEVLKNGATGYLLKDVEPSMLIEAIHRVNEGETFIYPELYDKLFGADEQVYDVNQKAEEIWRERRSDRLTAREMDVLRCIAKGYNNNDIAKSLFVSEKTVKNHLTNIFRKIHVNDRTQALLYVLKNKLIKV